jgi:AcrR family transcriptional regulator
LSGTNNNETRERIMQAAIAILGRDGYQGLSTRAIAREAGANLALMNYYFGSKQGLLLAIYDSLEREKFARQDAMYTAVDEPLSVKWRRAVDFYRQDLADGFVRLQHELNVQGYHDPVIAERARERIATWSALLREVAEHYFPQLGIDLPLELVVSALFSFWYGMEAQHLIGMTEQDGHFFEILGRVGDWLEAHEVRSAQLHEAAGSGE